MQFLLITMSFITTIIMFIIYKRVNDAARPLRLLKLIAMIFSTIYIGLEALGWLSITNILSIMFLSLLLSESITLLIQNDIINLPTISLTIQRSNKIRNNTERKNGH